MPTRVNDDVERRLLALEDAEDDEVRAVVAGALERGARYGVRRTTRVGLAAAAVCAVVAVAVVAYRHRDTVPEAEYSAVTTVGSLLLIEPREGPCWIVGPAAEAAESTTGGGYVLIEGEDR